MMSNEARIVFRDRVRYVTIHHFCLPLWSNGVMVYWSGFNNHSNFCAFCKEGTHSQIIVIEWVEVRMCNDY